MHSFKRNVVPATDTIIHEVGGTVAAETTEVVVEGVVVEQSSVVVEDVA